MIIMVYNTGKGKSPRNQQRSNPRGGPAGSGVPGQGAKPRRKFMGFKQVVGKDGVARGVAVTKARKGVGSGTGTKRSRSNVATIQARTRAAMAAKASGGGGGGTWHQPQQTRTYVVGNAATPTRAKPSKPNTYGGLQPKKRRVIKVKVPRSVSRAGPKSGTGTYQGGKKKKVVTRRRITADGRRVRVVKKNPTSGGTYQGTTKLKRRIKYSYQPKKGGPLATRYAD